MRRFGTVDSAGSSAGLRAAIGVNRSSLITRSMTQIEIVRLPPPVVFFVVCCLSKFSSDKLKWLTIQMTYILYL
jgi:hypothetical protein